MKVITPLLMLTVCLTTFAQQKQAYLQQNRFDMETSGFSFPQTDFNIIGFGAYHGSAKTELAEYALIKSLTKTGAIKYYLPETDFSIGYFFNQYLKTGDTVLLKELVYHYGVRVPQEKSVETYQKWKELKRLNDYLPDSNKLTVVGIDLLVTYKYTSKHLLELIDDKLHREKSLQEIAHMIQLDTTDFSPYYESHSKKVLKRFVDDYQRNPARFEKLVKNKFAFHHIIKNLKNTFGKSSNREKIIYDNYIRLMPVYNFRQQPQLLRFGFFHLEKQREGSNASFFTQLIENKIYPRKKVIAVIGYLTDSRVLWDLVHDDKGQYKSYTTEGGFGIGDYEKEYFRGIENLKKARISDMTLFRLNGKNTPYADGKPDLIEIVMTDDKSNGEQVKGKSTTAFMNYALLISNSKANTPIQEMK